MAPSDSLALLTEIAGQDFMFAVSLPVIVRDASEMAAPIHVVDIEFAAGWKGGLEVNSA